MEVIMRSYLYLYPKKYKCPACHQPVVTQKVKHTGFVLDHQDEDFCAYYKDGVNPYLYTVITCPHCGYSASESYYHDMLESQRRAFKKIVGSKWVSQDFGQERDFSKAVITYKLAIYQGEVLHYSAFYIANLCLKLAWLYRIEGKEEQEHEFLYNALIQFAKAYKEESFPQLGMNLFDCSYLIGELYRRLGDSKEAFIWFQTTLKLPGLNPRIENLAREQWRNLKKPEIEPTSR